MAAAVTAGAAAGRGCRRGRTDGPSYLTAPAVPGTDVRPFLDVQVGAASGLRYCGPDAACPLSATVPPGSEWGPSTVGLGD